MNVARDSRRKKRFVRTRMHVRITPDDVAVIQLVARHRLLHSTHLASLLPHRPPKKLIERIGALYHAGYLDRPRAQLDRHLHIGNAPMVYGLADRGRDLIQSDTIDWSEKNRSVKHPYIHHTLFIADILVAIELAVRARPDLEFLDAQALREFHHIEERSWKLSAEIFFGHRRIRFNVIPDAVFALRAKATGKCAYFFLEADRGTMTIETADLSQPSYQRKLLGYHTALKAMQHQERFGFQRARVLSVTTSSDRVQSMLRALTEVTRIATGRFLFADWPSLAKTNPLSHSWLTNTAPASIDPAAR